MVKPVKFLALALLAIPFVSHANAAPRARTGNIQPARHATRAHAAIQPISLRALDASTPMARPVNHVALARTDEPMPTSMDHHFDGAGALVGSVGYHRADYANHLEASEVDAAAASQFGAPDATLGVNLTYHFR
jgi:hypothetical protein